MAEQRGGGRYPKSARVRRKSEYERVFREGVRVRNDGLKLVVARRADPNAESRFGTAVSRKVGNAVRRNRVRRRLREAFRLERANLPAGVDVVCVPTRGTSAASLEALRRALRLLIAQALARLERRRRSGSALGAEKTKKARCSFPSNSESTS